MHLKKSNFTKITILLVVSFITVINCYGKKKTIPSKWQSSAIIVDGDDKDWSADYPFYDSKSRIAYSVSNDTDNLYIVLKTNDDITATKILNAGLTIALDIKGGKDETTEINYPLEKQNLQSSKIKPGERPDKNSFRKEAIKESSEIVLGGFKNCNGSFKVLTDNSCGIIVRVGINEYNDLIWEARIPISSFYKQKLDSTDRETTYSLGIFLNALPKPQMPMGGAPSNMEGGGMPGGGPGGMSGGMGGIMPKGGTPLGDMGNPPGGATNIPNFQDMEKMFEATRIWQKFTFSFGK